METISEEDEIEGKFNICIDVVAVLSFMMMKEKMKR